MNFSEFSLSLQDFFLIKHTSEPAHLHHFFFSREEIKMLVYLSNLTQNNQELNRLFFTIAFASSHSLPVIIYQLFLFFIQYFHLFEDKICQPKREVDQELVKKCIRKTIIHHCNSKFFFLFFFRLSFLLLTLFVSLFACFLLVILYPILIYFTYPFLPPNWITFPPTILNEQTTYSTLFFQFLFFILVEDFLLYWAHRALHTPALYAKYHKK